MFALPGVTIIELMASFTVNTAAELVIPPYFAVILAVPGVIPLASPPGAIVAIIVSLLLHSALEDMSNVLPLVYVAVAVYCCVLPASTPALTGVTAIDVT